MPSGRRSCRFFAFKQPTKIFEIDPATHTYSEIAKAKSERFDRRRVEPELTTIAIGEAQYSVDFIRKAHRKSPIYHVVISRRLQLLKAPF